MPNCRKKVAALCLAESVPVQPYRHEPYCLDSDEEATENDQQGGAEAGRYGEESTNKKQVVKNTRRPIL